MRRENRWKSCCTSFRHIRPSLASQQRRSPFHDLWSRGCYSFGDWVPNAKNELFHFEQQWWTVREEFRLNWRAKREPHGPTDVLSTQAQVRVRCQCEAEAIGAWKLCIKKGFGYCKEPSMRKARTQLGRAILHHLSGWNRYILSWRSIWKCCTTPLECKQPENVLLLMKVFSAIFWFITLCILLFIWISNRTLVIPGSSNYILWVNWYF